MKEFLTELYKILFIGSLTFIINMLLRLFFEAYGYFILKKEDITFILTTPEKLILWISISIFFAYLIH